MKIQMKTTLVHWSLALLVTAGAAFSLTSTAGAAQDEKGEKPAVTEQADAVSDADKAVIAAQLPFYPMNTCVVSGKPLDEDAKNVVIDGNLYRTCCSRCAAKIIKDSTEARKDIEAAVIAAQKPLWPNMPCPVSGEAFGGEEMGDPVDFVYGMRYFKLCCGGCKRGVAKDADKVYGKISAAMMTEQAKTYPLTKCVISGEELGSMGDPIDRMYGTTLVRLCCKGCVRGFEKNAAALAKQVKDARIDRRRGKGTKEASAPKPEKQG